MTGFQTRAESTCRPAATKARRQPTSRAARPGARSTLAATALLAAAALLTATGTARAMSGRDHLAEDLAMSIGQGLKTSDIPEADRDRTAECLAKAIAADIPDADASRLSDVFERRAQPDDQLQAHWLTITKQDGRIRYDEVMAQVHQHCADLGPYIGPMIEK